jgi:hypothetical protein
VARDRLDYPWCLALQPLLSPDGSRPVAGGGAKQRLEQELEAKVQGSGFRPMWAVLSRDDGTICTYATQADAALADAAAAAAVVDEVAAADAKMVLPVVALGGATTVELPQKYAGQHVIGLQQQQQGSASSKGMGKGAPTFFRFGTAEDLERWSAMIHVVSTEHVSSPSSPAAAAAESTSASPAAGDAGDAGSGATGAGVEKEEEGKKTPLFAMPFDSKNAIILPRQAQDKHRNTAKTQKRCGVFW